MVALKISDTKYIALLVLLLTALESTGGELKPFSSDGCSAFPDGTIGQSELWLKCCTEHDLSYWRGGTYKNRLKADMQLESCVREIGEPEIALLMLAGVRVGGTPFLPTAFRWGYGWSYPRLYGPLTDKELGQVKNLTSEKSRDLKVQPLPTF